MSNRLRSGTLTYIISPYANDVWELTDNGVSLGLIGKLADGTYEAQATGWVEVGEGNTKNEAVHSLALKMGYDAAEPA